MNKELEKAIKHVFDRAKEMALMYEYDYPHITKKLEEDIKLVEQALKRNEPMKINSVNPSSYYGGLGHFKCPKCGEEITEGYYDYCPVCGQKVDWSDEK